MDNLLNNNGFWTITGIVIGFILTFGSNFLKDYIHRRNIKKALKKELIFNCNVIGKKKEILKQMFDLLDLKNIYAVSPIHSMTNIYDTYISELSLYLNSEYKEDLHMIYSKLKINDKKMDEFEQNIKDDIRNGHKNYIEAYKSKIFDYQTNYDIILLLIHKHIK